MEEKLYIAQEVEQQKEEVKKEAFNFQLMEFAKTLQSNISNNFIADQKKNYFAKHFNRDDIYRYLAQPQKYEKELRHLSIQLATMSPLYNSIVSYFSSISKFCPVLIPNINKFTDKSNKVDYEKLKKDYSKASNQLELLNIQSQFTRILSNIMINDVFYGYEVSDINTSYFLQLDEDYCNISSTSDSCFNFMFDFSWFDSNNKLRNLDGKLIDTYPDEFGIKYQLYLSDRAKYRWQELSPEKTICIKFGELPFCFPPFASIYDELASLESYKETAKLKDENSAYKLIGLKIPLLNGDKPDNLGVSVETAMKFYSMVAGNLPSGIGCFIAPMDADKYDFNTTDASEKNKILDAEKSLFLSTGISKINFGDANTSTGLSASNLVDSGRLFNVYRKFECWLNRWFKYNFNGKFSVQLMDVTIFNEKDTIANYMSASQYGLPCKLQLASLLGLSASKERGLLELENALDIVNVWRPLMSSHTLTGDESAGGAPVVSDTDLSDSGEATRDNDSNNA